MGTFLKFRVFTLWGEKDVIPRKMSPPKHCHMWGNPTHLKLSNFGGYAISEKSSELEYEFLLRNW